MADFEIDESLLSGDEGEGPGFEVALEPEEERAPLTREQQEAAQSAATAQALAEIEREADMAGEPVLPDWLGGGSDFVTGLGNPLNIQQGLARMFTSGDEEKRLLETIEADMATRKGRDMGYGAGQMVGNAVAGAAGGLGASTALGAAGVSGAALPYAASGLAGAAEGAASEYARTGDPGDALGGAAIGAGAGVAGEAGGQLLRRGGQKLLESLPGATMRREAAERGARTASTAAAEMSARTGQNVPVPDVPDGSYDDALRLMMGEQPDVARAAVGGGARATQGMHPSKLSNVAALKGMKSAQSRLDRGPRDAKLWDVGAGALGYLGDWTGQTLQRTAPGLGAGAAETSVGETQDIDYAEMLGGGDMAGASPTEDHSSEYYGAFAEAYGDEALAAYPGIASELSAMLRDWSVGGEPDPSKVALMGYKLAQVPGLQWASLDPTRAQETTE